ncbi:MAG: membrane integrity-associated transporter subunit PqiC [Magnetococcales bacterium]|nr:membrane integrity-associated transporter subunit PqiC [Magnetococcales bacterium]
MKWHTAIGSIIMLLAVSGCSRMLGDSSPPTRYFILSPLSIENKIERFDSSSEPFKTAKDDSKTDADDQSVTQQEIKTEIGVAVEPMQIPSYLDRAEIVVRTGDNELDIAEFNKWGENFQGNLSRILVENLSILFESDKIYQIPSKKRRYPNFRVSVRIKKFERGHDGITILAVRWMLYSQDKKILFRESIFLTGQEVAKDDYPAIVKAMSSLWAEFSRRVVERVYKQQLSGDEK